MSSSRNYTELQTIWEGWRDVSGKKMKEKYAEFVKLSNQGIQELGLGNYPILCIPLVQKWSGCSRRYVTII